FTSDKITSETDLIEVITTEDDNGNLKLAEGKSLTPGKTYVFTVDLTQGNDKARLFVEEK
ncbi:MAG: DUF5121 domain-containing protein, partial [Tannerellaceae bacterium]|nr:DUF5121 domain-containing protein [Tannerellaceae bacterium]